MWTLAREHARFIAVGHALVLAEEIADLARADANVAGWHVGVLPEVPVQFGHQALAEAHHFAVAAALGVKIRATLGAADRHARERVLENLLKAEELDDAEIDRRVEPQAALVGAEHAVELHAKAAVDLHLAPVVLPGHAKDDLPLGLADALDDLVFGIRRMLREHRTERLDHFLDGLMKLRLAGIPADDLLINALDT